MLRHTGDIFVEYMVKKRKGSKDFAMIIGGVTLSIILLYISVIILFPMFGPSIPFFVLVGIGVGMYYLVGLTNLEFEYAFTNGDMSVDRITNRRSRKRLTSFETSSVEEMGNYFNNAEKLKHRTIDKTIFACTDPSDKEAVYVIAKSKKTGLTLVVFNPSERILEGMKVYLPRQIRVDYFGR